MHLQTSEATFGGLLHDIGKPVFRAGQETGTHSLAGLKFLKKCFPDLEPGIAEAVSRHHAREIREKMPLKDSIAYIVYTADNIASAADRREVSAEGSFERYIPLQPIFTHLNGEHPGYAIPVRTENDVLKFPQKSQNCSITQEDYQEQVRRLQKEFAAIELNDGYVNSLLAVLDSCTSTIPSSTDTSESPDISLYDHLKITAAVSACISEYVLSENITDLKALIWDDEPAFRKKNIFLLYSADFSGIQEFIYTVQTRGALKSLRSRSFILEMMMEHYIDELLDACGVSRANLLYSGGGHCYILLPNTEAVTHTVDAWNIRFNDYLADQFGIGLYLAHGYASCSADDLTNHPAEKQPYRALFGKVTAAISAHKVNRYMPEQFIRLNSEADNDGRECGVCGRTDKLVSDGHGGLLCHWCRRFIDLSAKIQQEDIYLVSKCADGFFDFDLPTVHGTAYYTLTDETSARHKLKDNPEQVIRIYTKNKLYTGLNYSTRIFVGDYAPDNSLENLAADSEGIQRLGILRMDVDNLGQAFVSGFNDRRASTPEKVGHFVTISRTAAFSRQMSLLFKHHINSILSGSYAKTAPLNVAIVYSGGDDIFLVGAWSDVIKASRRIRIAVKEYTCDSLTISGGITMVKDHYPVRVAAEDAAALEDEAKDEPGKNSVSLFETGNGQTYSWDVFEKKVLSEKYAALKTFFADQDTTFGNSFIYHILELLMQADEIPGKPIQLARIAYLLSRMEPPKTSSSYGIYKKFSESVYCWSLEPDDRKQLITAIYIWLYSKRERKGE